MPELVPGTLEMLILRTLLDRCMGMGSRNASTMPLTTCCPSKRDPCIRRCSACWRKGWVTAAWGRTGLNRRARFYTVTRDGRKQLGAEVNEFRRMTKAIERVLRAEG